MLRAGGGWQRAVEAVHAGIRSVCYRTRRGFDKAWLRQALTTPPVRLLRAKGIVRLAADPRWHEVHVVAGRMRLSPIARGESRESALVFIGAFDAADEERLRACLDLALA